MIGGDFVQAQFTTIRPYARPIPASTATTGRRTSARGGLGASRNAGVARVSGLPPLGMHFSKGRFRGEIA
jgi:hypothetical protein